MIINLVLLRITLHSRLQLLQSVIVSHRWTFDSAISIDYVPPILCILPFELVMYKIIVIHLCVIEVIKTFCTFVFNLALFYQLFDEVWLVFVNDITIIFNLHHLLRIPIVERTLNHRELRRRFVFAKVDVILKRLFLVVINAFVACILKFCLELIEFLYQYFFRHGIDLSSFLISYMLVPKYESERISCTYPTSLFLINNLPPLSSSWHVAFVTQDSVEHQNAIFIIVSFSWMVYFFLCINTAGEKPWLNIANCSTELCFLHISHLLLKLPYFNSFLELMPNIYALLNFLPILLMNCIKLDIRKVWHSRPTMNSRSHLLF